MMQVIVVDITVVQGGGSDETELLSIWREGSHLGMGDGFGLLCTGKNKS